MVPRVLKRNPDCYCILSLQFLILFYAPIPHFIIHTSWVLSQFKELKDGQASQETGAGCLGSPEAPALIPGALPAIYLPYSLSVLWHACRWLPANPLA